MDELKSIIKSISTSDYLCEWILNLQDNEILFSPNKNIRPCIQVDERSVRSDYWDGLTILHAYCRRKLNNNDVDSFIIKLLEESISIYKNDGENDRYKKLNSSDQTILSLLEIAISRPNYIDAIDVVYLAKVYFDSVLAWPFSFVHELYKQKDALLLSDKQKVLDIYITVIESSNNKTDYEDYLDIPEIIKSYPLGYYEYAKKSIISLEDNFYDMGAFYDYDVSYINRNNVILFNWLKKSSLFVDLAKLEKDILSFIESSSKLLKKIGLCLINLNFEKEEKVFFDNVHLFFNEEDFYADLKMLFVNNSRNIFVEDKKIMLCNELDKATFGLENDLRIHILKNHLSGIFKKNGYDVPYEEETNNAKEYAMNFNKAFYSIESDATDESKKIYDSINGLEISGAIQKYKTYKDNSYYYKNIVHKAFIKYLITNYPSTFCDYLQFFDAGLSNSLIFYFSNGEGKNIHLLFLTIKAVLVLCKKEKAFIDCLSSSLFEMRSLSSELGEDRLYELVNLVEYNWITIDEYDNYSEVINICINEELYTYIELICFLSYRYNEYQRKIIELFDYFLELYNTHKLKSLMAFAFPYLLNFNEAYALSKVDYIFNNIENGENLSYPLLSLSRVRNEQVLSIIGKRDDLKSFLSFKYGRGDKAMAQTVLFSWFFVSYLNEKDSRNDIINILFETNNFSVILELIRDVNYWLENNRLNEFQTNQYRGFLEKLLVPVSNETFNFDEVDQLIRAISKTIVLLENKYEFLWSLLIELFKHFKHYFSDESYDLIEKYQNKEYKNIIKVLNLYFSSYEQFYTYESTMISIFKLLMKNPKYSLKCREWKVLVVQKNPDLNDKI